jgi:predicted nuclease of predicted toxin-antitoxin system
VPQILLIDENVPKGVVEWLRKRGLNFKGVSDVGLQGAKDENVARYAVENNMIILTLDVDFAYIYHSVFRGSLAVIVVRVKPPTSVNIIELLNAALKKLKLDEFQKKLAIVTRKKIRIIG